MATSPTSSTPAKNRARRTTVSSHKEKVHTLLEEEPDGPVFRATIQNLEKQALLLRSNVEAIVKQASLYSDKLSEASMEGIAFVASLNTVPSFANAQIYLNEVFSQLNDLHANYMSQIDALVIKPLKVFYEQDLSMIEEKKKDFELVSTTFYEKQDKYMGKEYKKGDAKTVKKDQEYQDLVSQYALSCFDYGMYLKDIHVRKEMEALYYLTSFARKHLHYYEQCTERLHAARPQLDELNTTVTTNWTESKDWYEGRKLKRQLVGESAKSKTRPPTANKEGILYVLTEKKEWRKRWCYLNNGLFHEIEDFEHLSRASGAQHFELITCTAKENNTTGRRFCFDLIGPKLKRTYQASSPEQCEQWIGSVIKAVDATIGGNFLSVKAPDSPQDHFLSIKGNEICADCGAQKPEWVSINLGVFICIACSGHHRSLGSHISKVRSLSLDTWNPSLVAMLDGLGNQVVNAMLESTLKPTEKPEPEDSSDKKLQFITSKYKQKAFVNAEAACAQQPTDTLAECIQAKNLIGVLDCILHGANLMYRFEIHMMQTPLHLAVVSGDTNVIELLILNGAPLDSVDEFGQSALHVAARKHNASFSFLIGKGADPMVLDASGLSPRAVRESQ